MAITPCPLCKHYVEVPRITGARLFRCPYCVPWAPLQVVYLCTACMKVSFLPADQKTCPRCQTIVRPDVRKRLTARPHRITKPTEWVFHTTSLTIAHHIKRIGLRSTFHRTGKTRAHPEGAFARNRDLMCDLPPDDRRNPYVQRIKEGIMELAWAGMKLEAIEKLDVEAPKLPFKVTGGDNDATNLDLAKQNAFASLVGKLGKQKKKTREFFALGRDSKVKALAVKLYDRNHCLTYIAFDYVTFYYRIEEAKTAYHVYFLKNSEAVAGYNSYTKGVNKAMIVVLRLYKPWYPSLRQDLSEEKALCTAESIRPQDLEIFTGLNPDDFKDQAKRDDDANWQPIQDWP